MDLSHSPVAPCAARAFERAIARTPLDHFVVYIGSTNRARPGSLFGRVFASQTDVWKPVSVRAILQMAFVDFANVPLQMERAHEALRSHQRARPATHLLVRRTAARDYVTVTDVPWPSGADRPLPAGALVLDAVGRIFGDFTAAEPGGARARVPPAGPRASAADALASRHVWLSQPRR